MGFLSFLRGEKYAFIDYKSLRTTVLEVNAYINNGMSCFVYFNVLSGKTFTIEFPTGAVSAPAFTDKHILSLGRYNRQNSVPDVYGFADIINSKVEGSAYAIEIVRKKEKL